VVDIITNSYTYLDARDRVQNRRLLQRPMRRAVGRVAAGDERLKLSLFAEYTGGFLYTPTEEKSLAMAHLNLSGLVQRILILESWEGSTGLVCRVGCEVKKQG